MSVRVGVDIVEVERIAQALREHGEHFIQKIFTEREAAYCRGKKSPNSWAARFAAKEATAKALRVAGRVPRWTDVEVVMDDYGRPALQLSGVAAELAAGARLEVSLSHSHHYAVAMVVLSEA